MIDKKQYLCESELADFSRCKLAIETRAALIFEKYVQAGIFPSNYSMVGGTVSVCAGSKNVVITAYGIDDGNNKYVFHMPFNVFVSDEAIEADIERRSKRMVKYRESLSDLNNRKVYIAGKMTGLSVDEIFDRFNRVENILVSKYNAVLNPSVMWHHKEPNRFSRDEYLNICFAMLDNCDTVVVLPDYEDSYGTAREIRFAYEHGMEVLYLKGDCELFVLDRNEGE